MASGSKFTNFLKNLFFILIIIQFLPIVFSGVIKIVKKTFRPDTEVGLIKIGTIESAEYTVKKIRKFHENSDIKAILLKINSPGGLPGASQAIFNELKKFKKDKPIIAIVEDLCASGGYYIACISDQIIANPSSLIGSIGVRWSLPNIEKLLQKHNIRFDEVKSGKFKTILSMTRERSPEETTLLQNLSDDTYKQFTKDVSIWRKLSLKDEKIWADGKIFTGNQALELKLIDKLGSHSDALDSLKEILTKRGIKIEGKIKLIKPKPRSGFARFFGDENEEEQEGITTMLATSISSIWNKILCIESSKQAQLVA